ncbi:MAG: 16S rRNA (guanine(527)-N(7))-methyltransferase RsmG [Magnetovibrio sp.]|nr:16S rRNA (guanine(527)-N(7))-methyltransferase RsmG [Magnetovibrio sp.]
MTAIVTAADFQAATQVSDETLDRLQAYGDLLSKWQAKINLVGPNTLSQMWSRHMLDSAQMTSFIKPGARVVDMGSGAGFPGLVLAIMLQGQGIDMHLVESDQRKCSFLREVNRICAAGATIHTARIEELDSLKVDVVTSRALASLDKLLHYADFHRLSTGKCVFLKGKRWLEELTEAQKTWKIDIVDQPSCTEPAGRIIELSNIERI